MAFIDEPQAWILRLFEMEIHEGRGSDCTRFPEGVCPAELPLTDGERVFGVYRNKYYFTPASLIVVDHGRAERIPWADVRSCTSRHGEGKTISELTLADGRMIRVKVADMAQGWSGRISQLYHQMIEYHGQRTAMGRPLMLARDFFKTVADDFSIAPNLEPHPSLESFRCAVLELEQAEDGTRILMDLVEEDEEVVARAMVIVSKSPRERFQRFAESFRANEVLHADEKIIRRVGEIPVGFNVWHVVWD
jgi:hypothetical protein